MTKSRTAFQNEKRNVHHCRFVFCFRREIFIIFECFEFSFLKISSQIVSLFLRAHHATNEGPADRTHEHLKTLAMLDVKCLRETIPHTPACIKSDKFHWLFLVRAAGAGALFQLYMKRYILHFVDFSCNNIIRNAPSLSLASNELHHYYVAYMHAYHTSSITSSSRASHAQCVAG
jgi:hypothetical protein